MEKITHEVLLEMFLEDDYCFYYEDYHGRDKRFFEFAKGQMTLQESTDLLENYYDQFRGLTDREGFYE